MNRWIIALAATAALAGCKTTAKKVESITYQTGACFGTCPVYTVTVHSNGTGLFVGQHHTTVTGNQAFTVTPAQYAQFVNHLAPIRPASGIVRYDHAPLCTAKSTDSPSVDVKWNGTNSQQQELYYYYGCVNPAGPAMAQRLSQAPNLLPIGSYIH